MTEHSSPNIAYRPSGPSMLIRVLYFLLVGWWLGALVSSVAWFLVIIIIGLPLGLWLINRLPMLITLRPQEQSWRLEDGVLTQGGAQHPFWLRALYFVFVGWWFSGLWMGLAYLALITIIGIPLAFWMYGRVGAVTTLYRS
ncbi:MAG: YccF domain-containing protein [Chloroflexota bacterium]|nr:YccF domain-containing protein [Chloroflexota bacterium]